MNDIERSLVLLKPDAIQRAVAGEIVTRFERAGLKIVAAKMVWIDSDFSRKHYAEHIEKPFYLEMEKFITEGPLIALVLEGRGAIAVVRKMVGSTNPTEAPPGTIRGDYAHDLGDGRNLIHASANPKDAEKEVSLWFSPGEIHSYQRADERHTQHR